MMTLFSAGGVTMLPLAIVGLLAVAAGVRHASGPGPAWARAAATLRVATLAVAATGFALNFAVVASAVAGAEGDTAPLFAQGFAESLAPMILGGALTGLAALFSAVGDLRTAGTRVEFVSNVR
jgi:hypothetical protein